MMRARNPPHFFTVKQNRPVKLDDFQVWLTDGGGHRDRLPPLNEFPHPGLDLIEG